jgi:putative addiction module killer protein
VHRLRSSTKDNTCGIYLNADACEYLLAHGGSPFRERFSDIADARAKARIDTTIRKLERGLKPDVRSVGEGVHEARIDYGPGYRLYFGNDGADVVTCCFAVTRGRKTRTSTWPGSTGSTIARGRLVDLERRALTMMAAAAAGN